MPGRPRDSAVAESFLDMAGRGSTDPDRDLSLYEAHHLVATGVAGPYLQLGRIVGVSAQTGHLTPAAYVLYAGCFFWTLGYDTIYAHQDKEDDALIGVKSTALLFGEMSSVFILGFYVFAFALIAISALAVTHGWLCVMLLLPAGAHLLWQVLKLKIDDGAVCLRLFRSNRDSGFLIAMALIAAGYTI